jgi:hypothetical protein
MKKVLLILSVFCSSAFGSQIPSTDRLTDLLERESGALIQLEQRRFIQDGISCLRDGIFCNDQMNQFQDSDVEARYCITRCTGTGKDRVCYEVCYED